MAIVSGNLGEMGFLFMPAAGLTQRNGGMIGGE
jgi:hypothetical protein